MEASKARKDIQKYEDAKRQERRDTGFGAKVGRGMDNFRSNMDQIGKFNNIFGKPSGKKKDPFAIDFGGDIFGSPTRKPQKRKKRKKKSKSITIKYN